MMNSYMLLELLTFTNCCTEHNLHKTKKLQSHDYKNGTFSTLKQHQCLLQTIVFFCFIYVSLISKTKIISKYHNHMNCSTKNITSKCTDCFSLFCRIKVHQLTNKNILSIKKTNVLPSAPNGDAIIIFHMCRTDFSSRFSRITR